MMHFIWASLHTNHVQHLNHCCWLFWCNWILFSCRIDYYVTYGQNVQQLTIQCHNMTMSFYVELYTIYGRRFRSLVNLGIITGTITPGCCNTHWLFTWRCLWFCLLVWYILVDTDLYTWYTCITVPTIMHSYIIWSMWFSDDVLLSQSNVTTRPYI